MIIFRVLVHFLKYLHSCKMVEIIEFKNPENPRLHITNIEWCNEKEDTHLSLVNFLKCEISKYGLVHSVIAKEGLNELGSSKTSTWYAYVDMYSERAVHKAYLRLKDNLMINSKLCKIRKVNGRRTDYPLAKDKCEALANHYFGFNGWTTELLYHRHESSLNSSLHNDLDSSNQVIGQRLTSENNPNTDMQIEKFASAIRLSLTKIKDEELSVDGVAVGTSEWNKKFVEGKGKALAFASKQSRTKALQNAFSKILIIVLNDGEKVSAEINLEKTDPFAYNPVWDVPTITVNEVSYDDEEMGEDMRDSDFDGCFSQIEKL